MVHLAGAVADEVAADGGEAEGQADDEDDDDDDEVVHHCTASTDSCTTCQALLRLSCVEPVCDVTTDFLATSGIPGKNNVTFLFRCKQSQIVNTLIAKCKFNQVDTHNNHW